MTRRMSRVTIGIMGRGKSIDWKTILLAMPYRTNRELADEYNISIKAVSSKRKKIGIPNVKMWDRYKYMLGKVTDSELAEEMGIRPNTITVKRLREGIKAFRKRGNGEEILQEEFTKTLDSYEEYVLTDYGEIDILTNDTIYECKCKSGLYDIHTAVGQLLMYSNAFPDRELIIVVPEIKVKEKVMKAIHKLGIKIMTFDTPEV